MKKIVIVFSISICLLFPIRSHAQSTTNEVYMKEISDEQLVLNWRQNRLTSNEIDELTNTTYKEWDGWQEFIKIYNENQAGSEIWYYCSPVDTWENLTGSEGYAVFNGDRLIEYIVVQMN